MKKSKLVVLEGVDRTGKNTLWPILDMKTNYFNYIHSRGPIGFLAYDEAYKKGLEFLEQHMKDFEEWAKRDDVIIIYLNAPIDVLEERVQSTNHEPVDFERDLKLHRKWLTKGYEEGYHIYEYDTSRMLPVEIADDLLKKGIL